MPTPCTDSHRRWGEHGPASPPRARRVSGVVVVGGSWAVLAESVDVAEKVWGRVEILAFTSMTDVMTIPTF